MTPNPRLIERTSILLCIVIALQIAGGLWLYRFQRRVESRLEDQAIRVGIIDQKTEAFKPLGTMIGELQQQVSNAEPLKHVAVMNGAIHQQITTLGKMVGELQQQVATLESALHGVDARLAEVRTAAMDPYGFGKAQIHCLSVDVPRSRTAVIITFGQSNAANSGRGQPYSAGPKVANFDFHDGRCHIASDPLLGTDDWGRNYATMLGDILIERGLFDRVVIAPMAVSSTMVSQWAEHGIHNDRIRLMLAQLEKAGLMPDFILWHQGEADSKTDGAVYKQALLNVVATFGQRNVHAPFFVAVATGCNGDRFETIRTAQRSVVGTNGIVAGPDTDTLGPEYRYDTCHFNDVGLARHAALWADSLQAYITSARRGK